MRFEYVGYGGTLLDQVLKEHESKPIEFVFLDEEEFNEVFDEASLHGMLKNSRESWFTLKSIDIVFYLEH